MNSPNIYIERCIQLAMKANKNTKTNPMVGAVLVYQDRIIGEGFHEQYGGPHAEVNAINSVKKEDLHLIKNATLYVSLEPCNITGKTPPCSEKILSHDIKKLVIGTIDPNPLMAGSSIEYLMSKGVEIQIFDPNDGCKNLLRKFKTNLDKKPYIILKWAQSLDNVMGVKSNRIIISDELSKVYVHKIRSEVDGILIGKNTALIDNPSLTTRNYPGQNPTRILLDEKLEVPLSHDIFSKEAETIILNKKKSITEGNLKYINVDTKNIAEILTCLFENKIYSCLVEGGKSIHDFFIKNIAWQEAIVIKSSKNIASDYSDNELIYAPNLTGKLEANIKFSQDEILRFRNN